MALTKAQARKIAASFPGAYEKPSYGTPAFFVGKKLFTQVGSHKSKDIMLLTQTLEERDHLIRADPRTFYITELSGITKVCWPGSTSSMRPPIARCSNGAGAQSRRRKC